MNAASLRPWLAGAAPLADVREGEAHFAADLARPGGAEAFLLRTFPTEGLRRLLGDVQRRIVGGGGPPVVGLRGGFGGGKTHTLLALLHHCRGQGATVAVLAGTDLSPARPWPCAALDGRAVRTLWGELAAQLGGPAGYARVELEDGSGLPPGAAVLADLLDAYGPCVVLADELVPFIRPLYGSGAFEAHLTFLHNLTEAARRSRASIVVATIPQSEAEMGGVGGREAAERLAATLGRLEADWRPAGPDEASAIVRRRLFGPVEPDAATCRAFAEMYAQGGAAFPAECRFAAYLGRLRACYPVHPDLFDRLWAWAGVEGFQGTRGVLRVLGAAVRALWARVDPAPLLLPGGLPLDAEGVGARFTAVLGAGWDAVLRGEVDGEQSAPAVLEREEPRFLRAGAARRVARAVFLGAVPGARGGVERARVHLGSALPGEPVAVLDDALERLGEHLTHW